MSEILTTEDAAAYLGYSVEALRAKVRRKLVPHIRLNARTIRFRKSDLDAWLDSQAVEAVA